LSPLIEDYPYPERLPAGKPPAVGFEIPLGEGKLRLRGSLQHLDVEELNDRQAEAVVFDDDIGVGRFIALIARSVSGGNGPEILCLPGGGSLSIVQLSRSNGRK